MICNRNTVVQGSDCKYTDTGSRCKYLINDLDIVNT